MTLSQVPHDDAHSQLMMMTLVVLSLNITTTTMAEQKNDKKPEETPAAAPAQEKKKLPQLGALEDDDEFEVSESRKAASERSELVAVAWFWPWTTLTCAGLPRIR